MCTNAINPGCPTDLFVNGNEKSCYFLLADDVTTNRLDKAQQACEKYDPDAYLVELKTQEEFDHFLALDLFAGLSV